MIQVPLPSIKSYLHLYNYIVIDCALLIIVRSNIQNTWILQHTPTKQETPSVLFPKQWDFSVFFWQKFCLPWCSTLLQLFGNVWSFHSFRNCLKFPFEFSFIIGFPWCGRKGFPFVWENCWVYWSFGIMSLWVWDLWVSLYLWNFLYLFVIFVSVVYVSMWVWFEGFVCEWL